MSSITRREVSGWMIALALPLLGGGCDPFARSATIRYRITVEVATPQGLRTGSSVIQSTISMTRTFHDPRAISYYVKGQAVAVDLPGGTLFAVLNNSASGYDYPTYLLNNALNHGSTMPPLKRRYESSEWMDEAADAMRVKPAVVLQPEDYPTLLRFRDSTKASSMEVVDPQDLAAAFGAGVKLRRILLEVTEEQVTDSGRTYLANMGPMSDFSEWRRSLARDDVRWGITQDNFSRHMR